MKAITEYHFPTIDIITLNCEDVDWQHPSATELIHKHNIPDDLNPPEYFSGSYLRGHFTSLVNNKTLWFTIVVDRESYDKIFTYDSSGEMQKGMNSYMCQSIIDTILVACIEDVYMIPGGQFCCLDSTKDIRAHIDDILLPAKGQYSWSITPDMSFHIEPDGSWIWSS